jgi:rubrerythrin
MQRISQSAAALINRLKDDIMDSTAYQTILDQAIEAEIEAAQFYQDVSQKTDNRYLKDLFLTFSEEEKKHRRILETFRNDTTKEINFAKST